LTVKEGDHQTVTYEVPMRRRYLPPPALAANLGGQTRVVALDFAGTLFSYSTDGTDQRKLLSGVCTTREFMSREDQMA